MRDLRYAIRVLWKSPVFATAAILTLALCIGANTAIYTVVDRVLLRALPYPDPDRLVQVVTHFDRGGGEGAGQNYEILGRLKPGVTWAQADAQVRAAAEPNMSELYKAPATGHARIVPLQRGETAEVRQPLMLLWSAVGVVLLIGCVNIAG